MTIPPINVSSGSTLSQADIANYMRAAGFPESSIPTGVAIVMGESGGNTQAYNPAGGGNVGMWQINSVHGVSYGCATDPTCSTKFAYTLSNGGTNWQPWEAFTNGSFRQFLGTGQIPLINAGNTNTTASDPYTNITNFFTSIGAFTDWIGNPMRMLKIILGFILLGIALIMFVAPETGIAKTITTTGRRIGIR